MDLSGGGCPRSQLLCLSLNAQRHRGWGADSPQVRGVLKGGFLSVKRLPGGSSDARSHICYYRRPQESRRKGARESSLQDAATSREVLLSELWLYL